ncbi:glypican-4 isoform X1 [Bombus vosnesenskii]|uniref:Glypican-4 isoform X1 n=6 Tax=Pyrobombus TaxID=144703 RepID=A0A6J3KFM4_9HYME|nr:glypican-4 isoform X1 [Bombus impatiens]XP_033186243.1 glypican-4 isoform X1 [Bombus vancouverensis nearcticus]XP_033302980.1 glypican-4 isoform X1 [Bombus bifarius]XP_033350754.1 glypican-4 isoform X1 [Bombus vosnesenskii]
MSGMLSMLCVILILSVTTTTVRAGLKCDGVKPYFESQGFPATDIPKEAISSKELKVCGSVRSGGEVCCSADMEVRLQARARDKHEKATKETLQRLHQVLSTRGTRFHSFFKDLLANSKKVFHEMFKKTYGILYEQNSFVFTDLFKELENYYAKGTVDLDDTMDNFFNTLYQKMFTVLNSQYNFDNKYLECVGEHMKEIRPFGDVPQKLGVQIKRSFVATRAFSQALTVAADVLKNMQSLKPSADCAAALTRMTVCPSCSGIAGNVLACGDMCANVMKGCLAQHAALDAEWNHFVEAVDKVADRLLGPFNIEMLVRPINLKISEAIMNFQENSNDVSQRVFTGCGRPVLGRRRRRDNRELELESLNFDQETLTDDRAAILDKLVKETRQRVRDSRQFWVYLPYKVCNDGLVVPPSNTKECWNGTHVDKYIYPVSSNGEEQKLNPEVRVTGTRPTIVRDQVFALTTITNRLKSAYNGQDVDWIDTEDTEWNGSGSGSGDGPDQDPITDDEDGFKEGSGYEPKSSPPETPKQSPPVDHPEVVPPRKDIEQKTNINNNNGTSSVDNGASRQKISLSRALTTYLVPIVVMWFGGCLTEWL